jgi:predicted  nucleic acid-binding Zn-ribbon protein
LDAFLTPVTAVTDRSAIDDVAGLVGTAKTQLTQLDNLRRNLTDLRGKNSGNAALSKQAGAAKQEVDTLRKNAETLERRIKDNTTRASQLEAEITQASAQATQRATKYVKDLLSSVFNGMSDQFVSGQGYSSSVVSDQLRALLRETAFKTLREISEKGLV